MLFSVKLYFTMPKYVRKPRRSFRKKTNYPYKGDMLTRAMNYKMSANELASAAWKGVKYLKSIVNVEHQKVDFTVLSGTQSNTPLVSHVTAVAQGDGEGARTANSILLKYLYLKGVFQLNTSANYTRLRLVVIRDKQQIGDTNPAYTDVYENVSTIAFLNKNTVGRFDILYDKCMDLEANNTQVIMDKYIRLQSHARYNGALATDQQKGAIYVMLLSDQPTNVPTVSLNARLCYVDN